jgi:hypothetical protein
VFFLRSMLYFVLPAVSFVFRSFTRCFTTIASMYLCVCL